MTAAAAPVGRRRPRVIVALIVIAGLLAFVAGMLASAGSPAGDRLAGSAATGYTANGDDATGTGPSEIVTAFYRPQTSLDRLPAGVAGLVDPISSRLVQVGSAYGQGYDETVRFYVARGSSADVLCLIGTIANDTLTVTCLPRETVLGSTFTVTVGTGDRARRVLVDGGDVTFD